MKNKNQRLIVRYLFTPYAIFVGGIIAVLSIFSVVSSAIVVYDPKETPTFVVSGSYDSSKCHTSTTDGKIVVKCVEE